MKNGRISSEVFDASTDFFAAHSTFDKITTQACNRFPCSGSSSSRSNAIRSCNFFSNSCCFLVSILARRFASTSWTNLLCKSSGLRRVYLLIGFSELILPVWYNYWEFKHYSMELRKWWCGMHLRYILRNVRTIDSLLIIINDFSCGIATDNERTIIVANQQTTQQRGHLEAISMTSLQQCLGWNQSVWLQIETERIFALLFRNARNPATMKSINYRYWQCENTKSDVIPRRAQRN